MRFPDAQGGVSKIFTAEILSLIGAIFIAISGILVTVVSEGTNALAVFVLVLTAGFGILSLVAFVLRLVGLNQARKDEHGFATALIIAVIGIAISILQSIMSGNETVSSIANIVNSICQALITYYVCQGIVNLANKMGNSDMAGKGKRIMSLILVMWAVVIVMNIASLIIPHTETFAIVIAILLAAVTVVEIIVYLLYLSYLGKAKKMLAA